MASERERINIVDEVHQEFGNTKPTPYQLTTFINNFGLSDALAISSLILASWAFLYPRDPEKSKRCSRKIGTTNIICDRKIVHTDFDISKNSLVQYCERGHKSVKRIK